MSAEPAICPHGLPLADSVCGPCSKGQLNRVHGDFYSRNPHVAEYRGRLVELRSQEKLLRGAFSVVKHARHWRGRELWTLVGAITSHGSGYSQQICEELGWQYDMKITPAARLPERTR